MKQLLLFSAEVPRTPGPQESEEQLQDLCFFLCFQSLPGSQRWKMVGHGDLNEIRGYLVRKLTVFFFFLKNQWLEDVFSTERSLFLGEIC